MNLADILIIVSFSVFLIGALLVAVVLLRLYYVDRTQIEHSVLRNYPIIGRARYFLEKLGPEFRQYLYNSDTEGQPISRYDYEHIVKKAKYKRDAIGFGSQRNFEESGYYIRNSMFPKLTEELRMDRKTRVKTMRYLIIKDPLFTQREEVWEEDESLAYLLPEEDAVVIGPRCRHPFVVRGQIGMSALSYGSLGPNAITALSEGLGIAQGTWMNTGEGGLSPYHLRGGVDIIIQIGPGLFGVKDEQGRFNWEELERKSRIPQVRAFELKLGQGAKMRGGHIDAEKVTPEIARIRMVEPFKSIDSPNRFREFDDFPSMFEFMERMREVTGKPVGIKVVIGSSLDAQELAMAMALTGKGPDFITVDGGEGGTGASYQELADSVGLPIRAALPLMDAALRAYGVRERVKLIASGKLYSPDRIAIALAMGADLANIARGFMVSIGCIQTLQCHTNACPVGVATTDPRLQKALVVEEKKYRVANYLISLRQGLFRLAAAAGIASPLYFGPQHIVFKNEKGEVTPFIPPVIPRIDPGEVHPADHTYSLH